MSEDENFIILLNRIETTLQKLECIEKLLLQKNLFTKEIFDSKEAGLYMGLSPDYVCRLAREGKFPSSRPNGGKRYYKKNDLRFWLLSTGRGISSILREAEKLAIFHHERG